jgi:phenylalanyl-tRNA synthetase alpha chain
MVNETINAYKEEIVHLNPENLKELEEFRLKWLSKKGILAELFTEMKNIPAEDRKSYGQEINTLKKLAEDKFKEVAETLESAQQSGIKTGLDLSLEGAPMAIGSLHPLTITRNRMVDIFTRLGFVISEGPEIVDDWHNFTALNMPEDHPARDMQDTFFISKNPDIVMRTHTSSVQVKVMQSQKPPIRTIAPGRVFRKDSDATHSPVFHQVEGLYVDEGVSFADLKQTLFFFVQEMFGEGTKTRFRPSYFPFTEPSAEMDILGLRYNAETGKQEETWIEVLGCGMVDPAVLENCGIDSSKYRGFAFGIGIERMAMVKYNIQDIRLFYENDIRFLKQFASEI